MVKIFNEFPYETSILDDFSFYEKKQDNIIHQQKSYPAINQNMNQVIPSNNNNDYYYQGNKNNHNNNYKHNNNYNNMPSSNSSHKGYYSNYPPNQTSYNPITNLNLKQNQMIPKHFPETNDESSLNHNYIPEGNPMYFFPNHLNNMMNRGGNPYPKNQGTFNNYNINQNTYNMHFNNNVKVNPNKDLNYMNNDKKIKKINSTENLLDARRGNEEDF